MHPDHAAIGAAVTPLDSGGGALRRFLWRRPLGQSHHLGGAIVEQARQWPSLDLSTLSVEYRKRGGIDVEHAALGIEANDAECGRLEDRPERVALRSEPSVEVLHLRRGNVNGPLHCVAILIGVYVCTLYLCDQGDPLPFRRQRQVVCRDPELAHLALEHPMHQSCSDSVVMVMVWL